MGETHSSWNTDTTTHAWPLTRLSEVGGSFCGSHQWFKLVGGERGLWSGLSLHCGTWVIKFGPSREGCLTACLPPPSWTCRTCMKADLLYIGGGVTIKPWLKLYLPLLIFLKNWFNLLCTILPNRSLIWKKGFIVRYLERRCSRNPLKKHRRTLMDENEYSKAFTIREPF